MPRYSSIILVDVNGEDLLPLMIGNGMVHTTIQASLEG